MDATSKRFSVLLAVAVAVAAASLIVVKLLESAPRTRPQDPSHADTEKPADQELAHPSSVSRPPVASPGFFAPTGSETKNSPDFNQLIARLFDNTSQIKTRREAAWQLANMGTREAFDALTDCFTNAPPQLKATIAEAMGLSPFVEAITQLEVWSESENEAVARGALRGLGRHGGEASSGVLSKTLFDPNRADSVRGEAAEALGEIHHPSATLALMRALNESSDIDLLEHVLVGMGKQPLKEIETPLTEYLKREQTLPELRISAIEALGNNPDDVGPFLLQYAGDADRELREAAAWTLATADQPGDVSSQLFSWLQSEPEASVRKRIYQALANQSNIDPTTLFQEIQRESNRGTRLAGYDCLAAYVRTDSTRQLEAYFQQTAIPELRECGLRGGVDQGLAAVITLRRVKTAGSLTALNEIARSAPDLRVRDAAMRAVTAQLRQ